jgi:hypothetical protein
MRTLRSGHAFANLPLESALSGDGGGLTSMDAPLGLRVRVRVTHGRLDRQIAAGYPCETAPELALRARQLADPRTQREIARNLRGVIRYADREETRRAFSCVVIRPSAVRAGRPAISELAEQMERAGPVNPRGVVLAKALLTDGVSPLFNPYSTQTIAEAAREVQQALAEDPTIGS